MQPQPFNINQYLPEMQGDTAPEVVKETNSEREKLILDVKNIISQIEEKQIDITKNYNDWICIGFGFVNDLGEDGRPFFHQISRFHPDYDILKTDQKYDQLIKHNNHATTIATFFYIAKNYGLTFKEAKKNDVTEQEIPDAKEVKIEEDKTFKTPLLPDSVYAHLPVVLAETANLFNEPIEKDIYLLSAITVLSGCLPNIEGIYFNRPLSPHLYLFITGPSASGKGTMVWARNLARFIHESMYKSAMEAHENYIRELDEFESLPKGQKLASIRPIEPPRKMLFIPANSSSAALTQLLAENDFRGIIFESEADTLSNTAKQDWGDSSDIFRKAFHHENTSMARRTNREMIEITNPHLAICISGTPKQVHKLMPEIENGLFSRFMYYAFHDNRGFLNPFVSYQPINYDDFFSAKSYEVFHLFEKLNNLPKPLNFKLTEKQSERFTVFFQNLLEKNKILLTRDLDANTKRLGVITFRIAMVLTALRLMEMEIGTRIKSTLTCTDADFETAMTIASTLESHAVAVYQSMPQINMKGARLSFFEKLPKKFDRKMYLAVASEMGLAHRTADKYISIFKNHLLDYQYNEYIKLKTA